MYDIRRQASIPIFPLGVVTHSVARSYSSPWGRVVAGTAAAAAVTASRQWQGGKHYILKQLNENTCLYMYDIIYMISSCRYCCWTRKRETTWPPRANPLAPHGQRVSYVWCLSHTFFSTAVNENTDAAAAAAGSGCTSLKKHEADWRNTFPQEHRCSANSGFQGQTHTSKDKRKSTHASKALRACARRPQLFHIIAQPLYIVYIRDCWSLYTWYVWYVHTNNRRQDLFIPYYSR